MAKLGKIIFKIKIARMLTNLKDKELHISSLARASGCTYVYATKILHEFEREGVVEINKEKKYQVVKLTDKGKTIAMAIEDIFRKIEKTESMSDT
jgi:predicted transcriptional regulator